MAYRIGICDDEQNIVLTLTGYIEHYFQLQGDDVEIHTWNSGEELISDKVFGTGEGVDILFLDIELPDMNGVSIGQYIRNTVSDSIVQIVYISYKTSYAMQLFNVHPYDFLVKPIDENMIASVISGILHMNGQDRRFYTYRVNKIVHKVAYGDICYLASDRKHIRIVMYNGNVKEFVGKLKDEIADLPDYYIQIGQSYVVNYSHISQFNPESVVMDNGDELMISRGYRAQVSEKLLSRSRSLPV